MSTFGGIEQAGTALNAASYGLQLVSQNIANASTPGYTRQVANQSSVDGVTGTPQLYTRPAAEGGVNISSTSRANDPVIDARARTEHARSSQSDATASALSQIEDVFPEPSDTGLSEQLNTFWNSWSAVANDPGAQAPRTTLISAAQSVAGTLNSMSTSLSDVAGSQSQALGVDVAAANSAASQLATLNGQIGVATATGESPNALLDQRDTLLTKLSTLVGGVAAINANGSATVTVGGQTLVSGVTSSGISVDPTNTVSVGSTAVTLTGGSASAEQTALTTTIPTFQAKLDAVANALSGAANTAQAAGFDLTGAAGTPLFSGSGAGGIAVALSDPNAIAASSTPGGNLDGSNALASSHLGTASGSPDTLYTALVGVVGSASALAQQQASTQDSVTTSVDALQQSASGVSDDEEVSNMLTYQHAYQAASRVLTTIDSMLDTLINHTGMVGQA